MDTKNSSDSSTFITPEDLVAQLRALRTRIPEYGQLTVGQTRQLVGAARAFTPETTAATVAAAGVSSRIETAIGYTPEQLQTEESDAARWAVAEQELAAMYKGVAKSNLARRSRIGYALLQAYALGRRLVRQTEHADLLPHVAEMTRAFRARNRKRPTVPSPSPEPAPAPEPQQPMLN